MRIRQILKSYCFDEEGIPTDRSEHFQRVLAFLRISGVNLEAEWGVAMCEVCAHNMGNFPNPRPFITCVFHNNGDMLKVMIAADGRLGLRYDNGFCAGESSWFSTNTDSKCECSWEVV